MSEQCPPLCLASSKTVFSCVTASSGYLPYSPLSFPPCQLLTNGTCWGQKLRNSSSCEQINQNSLPVANQQNEEASDWWRHGMRPDPRGPASLWLHPRQSEQLSQPLPVLSLTSDPGAAMARRLQYWALMLQCKDTSHRWRVSWIRLYTAAAHTNRIAHVETEKAKNSTKDVRAYGKSPDSISRGWFLSSRHDEYVSGFWSL